MLITGVCGDIGRHLGSHFVTAGWAVCGIDQRPPAAGLEEVRVAVCDLRDGSAAADALAELLGAQGTVGVLVNCAGLIANSPLVSLREDGWTVHDFALWDEVLSSNLTTAFHTTALIVKRMLEARRPGVVVNISSVCARGNPGQVAYSAAKAGLDGMTRALARELGPFGIRVVGIAPGYFDTASTRDHMPAARLGKVTAALPLKRLGAPAEIASAIEFVVSNGFVTGTVIDVNGGQVL
jgi:3-oxoacyl-[acyl-carrier protein] reductase